MRRLLLGLIALGLVLALPNGMSTAFAHGGQYRGPAGEVPPDSRQPEDPPPPDTGGGTPTPPDGGPGTPTPPDGGGTPTPPDGGGDTGGDRPAPPTGGATPPGGSPPGGTKTGGKVPTKKGPSYESWLFWWNYNKDEVINIKSRIRAGMQGSGSGGIGVMTSGANRNEGEARNVTAQTIEAKVVPVLKEYARDNSLNFDIQSAAVIGLAKIGRTEEINLMMEMARNDGTDRYHKVVEESAALSLGILQHRDAAVRDFLSELALNQDAQTRTRAFALFSLGLLGDTDGSAGGNAKTLEVLKTLVSRKEADKGVPNSALVAMGLLGDRSAVPDLLQWLNEEKAGSEKLNDLTLSYVAAALGKIGQPGVEGSSSREVLDALRDQLKRKNRMTKYSTIIALGQIAPQADEKIQRECVAALSQVVKSGTKGRFDTQAVNFALSALGRIAGVKAAPDGTGGTPEAIRADAVETLVRAFDDRKASTRNFAALGLGLAAMDQAANVKAPIQELIRNKLARESGDVQRRGALVIALGMLQDKAAVPLLQALLEDRGEEKKLRGTAAVALGLIGDRKSLPAIQKALAEKQDRELRVDTAIAAGLLKDNSVTPTLVEILQDPKSSQFILGSVAMALGQIGDERAVEPLKQILADEKGDYPPLTRALACVALGQIGDKTDIPVLSRISRDVNYRAYYDAIGEVLTII